MNLKLQKLESQRKHLIALAASQRLLLANDIHLLNQPLAMVDKALVALRYIKQHPIIIAGGGVALLSILKPCGISKWYRRSWLARQIFKKFRNE